MQNSLWHRQPLRLAAMLCLGVVALPASASSIRPAFSADGLVNCTTVPPFVWFTTYIFADLYDDAAASGVTGAEFRLDGIDPAWFNTVTPSPDAVLSLGNPIAGGCNIAFSVPGCHSGVNGLLLLYTIQSLALAPITPRTLQVGIHVTPSCGFCCVVLTLCDAPAFSKVCVLSGQAQLNGNCPTVSTHTTSWSQIKSLYD